MTKALALWFFGFVYATSGLNVNVVQPADVTIKDDSANTDMTFNPDGNEIEMVSSPGENEAKTNPEKNETTPAVNNTDKAAAPEMISRPKENAQIEKSVATSATVDEETREKLAIARVRERLSEEKAYTAVAYAQATAENARTAMTKKTDDLHKREISEREERERTLKQKIDAALAGKPDFNLLKRRPDDNVTISTEEEEQAIERVKERTREELEYKTIAAALASAENERLAAVTELENMHQQEKAVRKDTESTLEDALNAAIESAKAKENDRR